MTLIKKFATVSALCIGVTGCFSNLYATNTSGHYNEMMEYGFKQNITYASTSGGYEDLVGYQEKREPRITLSKEVDGSDVYLIIELDLKGATVKVDGSSNGVKEINSTKFRYKVKSSGTYEVEAWVDSRYKAKETKYISVSDSNSNKLVLSKKHEDGKCYLVIEADDEDGIKSVTVDGEKISFSSNGGTEKYRVYNSGTYKVVMTDKEGNKTTKSLYINVDDEALSLTLSKEKKSEKWYLVIKADSDNKIKKVTVDGDKITFPESGGTEKYEVTKTGTYKVVVTDKEGYTITKSLYIDVNGSDDTKPVVTLSQNYKTNNTPGWYLLINATDDGKIASVTVNGVNVPFDQTKGMAQYYVPVDGNYTVVVTDNDGNSTTKTTYAAGNAGINNAASANTVSNIGNAKIIFKLNSKSWTQNGIAQEQMTVAPKVISSRVYLPIRYIAYALGIDSGKINWDSATQTVTIYDNNNTIQVKIGSKTMKVNNQAIAMDCAPTLVGGRVMLPISQIKAAFANKNIQLSWDNTSKQLTIIR